MVPPIIPKDVLDDLCSRFLVNVPASERDDNVRLCFQIEQAHWFYMDYYVADHTLPDCVPIGQKDFIRLLLLELEHYANDNLYIVCAFCSVVSHVMS